MTPGERSAMGQLAAKLENDARNELHSVMGMLSLIAEGPLTETQYGYLRACRTGADHLLRTIQNFSEFLSPEKEPAHIAPFDLKEAIANVTSWIETLAQRKGLGFTFEAHLDAARWVAGDRERIQDILFRVLDNAVRFTDQGHVQLTATEVPHVPTGIMVHLDVCDTGPGIPAEIIAWVSSPCWENLVQNGLGLPIARKLALSMGGQLTIGSREGGGSRVIVSLPLAPASPVPSATEASHADGKSGPPTPMNILVAEDSDDSYFVLASYLTGQPFQLTRALDGVSAVELFKNGLFDLVLMDVHMPGADGYSVTRAIREWETTGARARVPIVILSSDSPKTQIQSGAKVGCSGYLTKPVTKAALLEVLRRYWRTSTDYWIP